MYDGKKINYVTLEENINNLLEEEKIHRLRNGLIDFVTERLKERVLLRLKNVGIDEELEQAFIRGDKAQIQNFYRLLENKEKPEAETGPDAEMGLGLSQEKIREIKRVARCNRKADPKNAEKNAREARENALCALREILLKEEKVRFRKEADIAPKVWGEFLDCDKLTGEPTLQKLRSALQLTPGEIQEFDSHVVASVFWVDDTLRKEVFALRRKTGMNLSEFQIYACIGREAWEAFYTLEEETAQKRKDENKSIRKKTSQKTLLKLVIGFGLDEDDAWRFMETAKSAFVVRRDLVFLACIRCDYKDPIQVQQILDFFGVDQYGQLYYSNPYDGFFTG